MRSTVRVEHVPIARDRIQEVGARARRPEPALRARETLADLQASERRRFARPFRPASSAAWAREKRRRGLNPRTLRATGRLEAALVHAQDGVGVTVWNRELRWGLRAGRSDVYYGQVLAKKRPGHKSWRFVVIDKPAKTAISQRAQTYIADGVIQ